MTPELFMIKHWKVTITMINIWNQRNFFVLI